MKWSNRVFANVLGLSIIIFASIFQPFVESIEIESQNRAWDVIGTPSGGVYTGGSSFSRSMGVFPS